MRRPLGPLGLAAGLYLLLTIALTWPLALHPGSLVPNDLGDSLLNMFLLAWDARVVPFTERWWNLPQFFPTPGVMAFSEHLLGLSAITTPVILSTGNALLAYNVAFFLSFPLCALAAHLLGYELTRRHDAALIAGLAYGFAPYRMSQFAHVQVLSAYWIPLSLLGMHLCLRRREWRWAVLFGVSWWMQALSCGYYLFYLSALVGLWLLWFAVRREAWPALARLGTAWVVAGLALLPVALGYLRYSRTYGLRRWPEEIQSFSADIASLLTAPGNLRLWGWLNVVDRPESQLFPGVTILLLTGIGIALAWAVAARSEVTTLRWARVFLAAAGLFALVAATPLWFGPWRVQIGGFRLVSVGTPQKPLSIAVLCAVVALAMHPSIRAGWRRRSPLAFYSIGTIAMWLFCLGPAPTFMNQPLLYKAPYSWLMLLPGVEGVRVPARFWVLATMCLAVAACLALVHVTRRWPSLRPALPATVAALLLVEAWPEPIRLLPPPAERPAHSRASLRLELPLTSGHDLIVLYRAIEHRRPVANGYSGYFAPHYAALQQLLEDHDPAVLAYLASFGPLEAVVDHDQDRDRRWRGYLADQPGSELAYSNQEYSTYHLPRGTAPPPLPAFTGAAPLPISNVEASLYQDLVGKMADGDRLSRWHTGGPQDPTNQVVIDLGESRVVTGLEMEIAGYVADFPRQLVVELSDDKAQWRTAWSGRTAFVSLLAALHDPLAVPLRFAIDGVPARYVRLRQTDRTFIYYWSIAELHVFGR
jgi:hypothetical protein